MLEDLGLGTKSQLIAVDTSKPTRIGCRTFTPAAAEITPVTIGKIEPPICANTNTIASAVAWICSGKSLEPSEMPYKRLVSENVCEIHLMGEM